MAVVRLRFSKAPTSYSARKHPNVAGSGSGQLRFLGWLLVQLQGLARCIQQLLALALHGLGNGLRKGLAGQ